MAVSFFFPILVALISMIGYFLDSFVSLGAVLALSLQRHEACPRQPLGVTQLNQFLTAVRDNLHVWAIGSCGRDVNLGLAWAL